MRTGEITDATALQLTNSDGRSVQIKPTGRPNPPAGGAAGAVRPDPVRQRRDLHQRGLHDVRSVRDRQGRTVSGVATFETMGTVVSLRGATPETASAVRAVFAGYDHRYSLYDPSYVLSRVADVSLRLADTPTEVRDVYALALDWRERTGGSFTPPTAPMG